ncbi:helix-turn-helix domain-containing protein [Paenarthrobacter sp. PH39-S1]|uniref:GlxA family transcriptional regulator n=1 Tax=Paenarthrobacter sp. PH39-S1 TaxID=3046204 RepID=UPI0024BBCA2C|nr:helix-turn-helix domain-containing protein [Paenarthrobacter sp. PH39-S1]MDJ0356686.1 helix-turn-helix domain-containing protein [Paenarthrobacter sp. PH39-S1]
MMRSVAVIALPGLWPFEFGVVCEVFGVDRSHRGGGLPAFDFRVCTEHPGPVTTDVGFSLLIEHDLSAAEDVDLLIMLPYNSSYDLPDAVIDLLRRANARGAHILSLCSGAFALAEAGILDDRRATTHWMHSQQLAADFPLVTVDENVLYIQDGNVTTSAGTAAGIDACLHLIRKEFGAKTASAMARDMVVPPHRDGGQAQYIDRPVPAHNTDTMEELLPWMADHLDEELPVSRLAVKMHMSERTFARRFRAETGTTPAAWVNAQRLLRAQALLEETHLSIDAVARTAGFGEAVLLRHHFHKALGISPMSYRRTFQGRQEPVAVPV